MWIIIIQSDLKRAISEDGDSNIATIMQRFSSKISEKENISLDDLENTLKSAISEASPESKLDDDFFSEDSEASVFLRLYVPKLFFGMVHMCDTDVDKQPLTDKGKAMLRRNQSFFCAKTKNVLGDLASIALWNEASFSGRCEVNLDPSQYRDLNKDEHSSFVACLGDDDDYTSRPLAMLLGQLRYFDPESLGPKHVHECCSSSSSDESRILFSRADPSQVNNSAVAGKYGFPVTLTQ